MARPYNALRDAMKSQSVTQRDLAVVLRCTKQQVSNKFRGISQWNLDEIWSLMTALRLDPSEMAAYFPYKGHNE